MKFMTVAVMLMMWASPSAWAADAQAEKSATRVCTLKVSGMTCAGCEVAVRMAARSVEGVTAVKASYAKASAEIGSVPSSGGNSSAPSVSGSAWTLPRPWTEEHRPPPLGKP